MMIPNGFGGSSRTRDSSQTFSKAGLLDEISPALMCCELNVPPVQLVFFFFFFGGGGSVRFWTVSSQPCSPETTDYSVSSCFLNIKMTSNIINVDTNFRQYDNSAPFGSGRLSRFHIPKFNQISVTLVDVFFRLTL